MIYKKYRVVLSREVLVTPPVGAGIFQIDTVDAVLLVSDLPQNRVGWDFEGEGGTYYVPGPWKIVKMDVELHDPSQDVQKTCDTCEFGVSIDHCSCKRVGGLCHGTDGYANDNWTAKYDSESCKAGTPDRIARTSLVQPRSECFGRYNPRAVACAGLCCDSHECGQLMFPPKERKPVERRKDDPPDASDDGVPYQDIELESLEGIPIPKGRFVLRIDPDCSKLWDRTVKKWVVIGTDLSGAARMKAWLKENVKS